MEPKEFHKKGNKKPKEQRSRKEDKNAFPYTFLGVNIEEPEKLYNIVLDAVSKVSNDTSSFNSDDIISLIKTKLNLSNENKESNSIWKFTKTFHITTFFHYKNYDRQSPILLGFEENREATVKVLGVAVVPNNIITLIVLTNELAENKFPHVTFMIGNYKPVMSNNVMCALFDQGGPYEKEYQKIKEGEKCPVKAKITVKILDKDEDVYLELFETPIEVKGKLKGFK